MIYKSLCIGLLLCVSSNLTIYPRLPDFIKITQEELFPTSTTDPDNVLFWLDNTEDKMYRADINPSTGDLESVTELLDLTTLNVAVSVHAISIDETNSKIYWTDMGTLEGIFRSDLDGSNAELYEATPKPRGVYVDDVNGYIYYTDDENNQVKRMDIVSSAASAKNSVTITGLSNIDQVRSVAFDADNGKIFWTDNNGNGTTNTYFSSADLTSGSTAATNQSSLLDMGTSGSLGLHYDEVNDRIFLAQSNNVFRYYEIAGGTFHSITSPVGGGNTLGIAADAASGYIYVGQLIFDEIGVGDYPAGGNSRIVLSAADSDPGTSATIAMTIYSGPLVSAPNSATVAVTVFLEGAYNGTNLNTSLNSDIPLTQPYSNNGHSGGSSGSIPANAVDWVLVELREAGSAAAALNATKVGSTAGFLMKDGTIKAPDGTSDITVSLSGNSGADFFVVIYHRNHLPIMSASAISESSSKYTIDFTSSSTNTHQTTTALASLSGGKFGMPSGDADGDGDVDGTDLTTWQSQNGNGFTYNTTNADFNLDGEINAIDRNLFWKANNTSSKTSKVPTT